MIQSRCGRGLWLAAAAILGLSAGFAALEAQTLQIHLAMDGDLTDSSGNGLDGFLIEGALGGHSYVDGPVGQALKLEHDLGTLTTDKTEGTSIELDYRLTEEGTIAFWYRASPYYNYQNIWNTTGEQDDFEMWVYQDGIVRGRIDGEIGQVSHQLPGFNVWYHIAYTWQRGGGARLWVDGIERDTGSGIRAISEAGFDNAILGDFVYLGGGYGGNTYANGALDDFRIYDGVLPDEDIIALFDLGTPPVEPFAPVELLAHLAFEADTIDSSGNGNDGLIVLGGLGDYSYIDGPVGKALKLDHDPATLYGAGADTVDGAYVSIPLTLPEEGSIAFWYRVTDFYDYQTLFDTSGDANDWEMWIYGDGQLRGRIDGNVGQVTQALSNNHWYHIAYTWKRGDQARLWVDGEEKDVNSGARGIYEGPFDAAILGDTVYIGGGNDGNTFAIGAFDDFRIYSGVLDGDTVQELFDAGDPPDIPIDPGKDPELQIHWNFEDDVTDSSGKGNDGELVVGPLGSASYIEGPVGKALDFDHDPLTLATDTVDGAYVQVLYPITEEGSILLWYRAYPFYNYQTIWDNSENSEDWEMWIYGDNNGGILRGRVDGNVGQVSYQLDRPGRWFHLAYTWKTGDQAHLYINGEEQDVASTVRGISEAQFAASLRGDYFYLGGGHPSNVFGVGAIDDFRMYDGALDADAVLAIFEEGDPPADPVVVPADPGPAIIHWPMDGDTGNVGVLGSGYDGELIEGAVGTPEFVSGQIEQGLSLDNGDGGTPTTGGSYVRVLNPISEEGAIALWYYARPFFNYQTIYDNSTNQDDWEMWIYNTGILRARIDANSGVVAYDLNQLGGPNQWYHIAYSWDLGAGVADLFVNGEKVNAGAVTHWLEPGEYFYLGGGNDGNTYGNGVWDDVRIYDFALTAGEVQYIMNDMGGDPVFLRGDTDGNGQYAIGDGVQILERLFTNRPAFTSDCDDAGDFDDNGVFTIGDAIGLFNYLFADGKAPEPPGPTACGTDPTPATTLGPCNYPADKCP
ncbi:MAG: LamG domain-containing protein [Planctomycetes bacterium]|nr:LamG domain-containing protein [Planctomycetota bacterium]